MFDAKKYRANRKAGKRGQEEVVTKVIHPKGTAVEYETREGDTADYPNDLGKHFVPGRGLMNRKQAREKLPHDPKFTKKQKKERK